MIRQSGAITQAYEILKLSDITIGLYWNYKTDKWIFVASQVNNSSVLFTLLLNTNVQISDVSKSQCSSNFNSPR